MKKLLAVVLSVTMMASLLSACAKSNTAGETTIPSAGESQTEGQKASDSQKAAADPKVTLSYAEVNSETSLMGMTAQKFKEEVERLSGGSVEIQIYAGGVFGAEGDVLYWIP